MASQVLDQIPVEGQTLVVLKDREGFEFFIEGETRRRSWYISHYPNLSDLFSVETKEDGKVIHGFVVSYSSLNVRNLYEIYKRILTYPEKTIRDLLGKVTKIGKIIIIKKDDVEGFKCCPHILRGAPPNEKKVTINMWLSKIFLKKSCDKYLAQLNVVILEHARDALMRIKEVKKVKEWRHYCGAEPRYWEIEIKDDGSVEFKGGIVWRAKVEGDILHTDGCTTRGLLIDVIDEGIRQVSSLKCKRA